MPIFYNFHIFLATFYIIFGTNILIQCPVPVPVFCLFFVSQKIHIKRSPNTIKFYGELFWNICDFWEVESTQTEAHGLHKATGHAAPRPRGDALWAHRKSVGALLRPQGSLYREKNCVKISVQSELRISGNIRNGFRPENRNAKQKRTEREREIQSRRGSCPPGAIAAMDQRGNSPPI
jgi:hypothetical protein